MLQNTAIRLNSAEKGQQRSADETEKRDEEVNDMLDTTELYYFSPTGGTRKAARIFSEGLAEPVMDVNLGENKREIASPEGDLVVAAAPVFGGRIPGLVSEKLKKIDGNGKKAVTLAVYGNRAYDDALLELNRVMEEQGFQVIASAALVAQHSMAPEVAQGRPDDADSQAILNFSRKVLEKLECPEPKTVTVPGNYPYKEAMNMPAAPVSLPDCTRCGTCEKICPTDAIRVKDGAVITDAEKCILCMACTAACPQKARILPPPLQEKMEQKLGALKAVRRENEFFL